MSSTGSTATTRPATTTSTSTSTSTISISTLLDTLSVHVQDDLVPYVVAAVVVLISTAVGLYLYVYRGFARSNSSKPITTSSTIDKPRSGTTNPTQYSNSTDTNTNDGLKSVWDAPRNAPPSTKQGHTTNKPFGSKYYYAHNNPNTKGGYKDGLRMEDYTMNGPRLLSKGTGSNNTNTNTNGDRHQEASPSTTVAATTTPTPFFRRILAQADDPIPIHKYLWDDPGNATKGIATIRIDSLPEPNSSSSSSPSLVDVASVKIQSVKAELKGEGLVVQIQIAPSTTITTTTTTTTNSRQSQPQPHQPYWYYRLYIPKLYGDASKVETIVKANKRVLVKIYKKQKGVLSGTHNDNLKAWPQPHRKI